MALCENLISPFLVCISGRAPFGCTSLPLKAARAARSRRDEGLFLLLIGCWPSDWQIFVAPQLVLLTPSKSERGARE